jgi:hypothetical protein
LGVFCKFQNPSGISKSKAMRKTYYDLLFSGNPAVQKAALDCILAFGPKACPAAREGHK